MTTMTDLITSLPVGGLVFVLVILPFVFGLLVYALRGSGGRTAAVVSLSCLLTAAAILLFVIGATERRVISFDPSPIAGISWDSVIQVADFALLIGFVAVGVVRRSVPITLLALAQLLPLGWFELIHRAEPNVRYAMTADWLSIVLVMIVSIIGSVIAVYALPYMRAHEQHLGIPRAQSKQPRFFLVMLVFLGAMNGLALANNALWLYFFWELTTLCSFLLIGHDGTEEAWRSADRALWMNLLGGAGFVAGIILLQASAHTLSIADLLGGAGRGAGQTLLMLSMACLCFAGFTKSAQMPFQSWLLGAMVAPTPVSALLHSSTMVKAGVYLIVRLSPVFHDTRLSQMVAVAGAFTFAAAALIAIGQSNAKRVLAYSTVSNLGLIIACAGLNAPLAMAAAVMLMVFHAISKGLLFMATGVVEQHIRSRDIEDMQGLVTRMPLTTGLMVVGILSMLLPPFGVLIAKLAAIEASTGSPPVMVLMVLGSTFTVVFWVKWTGRLLTAEPSAPRPPAERLPVMSAAPLVMLAAGAVAFSLFVVPVLRSLVDPAVSSYYATVHAGMESTILSGDVLRVPWMILFGILAVAVIVPLVVNRVRPTTIHPAYLCGEQAAITDGIGFRTVAEGKSELTLHNPYYQGLAGEQMHTRWANPISIALIAILFALVIVWR